MNLTSDSTINRVTGILEHCENTGKSQATICIQDIKNLLQLANSSQDDSWDTATRGEKMSDTTGLTIFKYQMPVKEEFDMTLPKGAKIIRVDDQDGMFWMWAVVDTNATTEKRKFKAFKTGGSGMDPSENLNYIGFCKIYIQMELGLYIFEVVD